MKESVLKDVLIPGKMLDLVETVDKPKPQPVYTLLEILLVVFNFVQITQKHVLLAALPAHSKL